MTFWKRIMLVAWLLTGLIAAPAMSFGMPCHAGQQAVGQAIMSSHHHSDAHAVDADLGHKKGIPAKQTSAISCAASCLSACTALAILESVEMPDASTVGFARPLPSNILQEHRAGPALEPPIDAFA